MDERLDARIARLLAAGITLVLLTAGFVLQGPGDPGAWMNAGFLVLVFYLPARKLARPAHVLRSWKLLLAVALGATLAWDVATGMVVRTRPLLSEWYLVYPAGALTLMILYLLHATAAGAVARYLRARRGSP